MILLRIRTYLMIGLLAVSSTAFGQATSFLIECQVSGEVAQVNFPVKKISDQKIIVSVSYSLPYVGADYIYSPVTVLIEGHPLLHSPAVKYRPIELSDSSIKIDETFQASKSSHTMTMRLDRIAGFIDVRKSVEQESINLSVNVSFSGFCSKINNTQKF